jgi:hypothetical protein
MTVEISTPDSAAETLKSTTNGSAQLNLLSPPQSTSGSGKQIPSVTSSPTNAKSPDERSKSPLPSATDVSSSPQNLTINCTTTQATSSNNSSGSSASISPISKSFSTPVSDVDTRKCLKRNRDSSCESEPRPKSTSSESQKSPVNDRPPVKVAKVSYSIMNILGNKESQLEAKSLKPATASTPPQITPDITAIIQQQIMAAAAGGNGMGQFMMNPFLAAAAAFSSANGGNQHHHQQQAAQMPWFNMSGLYGFDSK